MIVPFFINSHVIHHQALRNMNNYNTLMAILAGINSAPIMRLKNTRDLITVKKIHKQFRSLEKLMGSDK